MQIRFYSGKERLVRLGYGEKDVRYFGGRREIFEIAKDEQLIGCELDHRDLFFMGVTWLKMKIRY
jgi:hypothetical protein